MNSSSVTLTLLSLAIQNATPLLISGHHEGREPNVCSLASSLLDSNIFSCSEEKDSLSCIGFLKSKGRTKQSLAQSISQKESNVMNQSDFREMSSQRAGGKRGKRAVGSDVYEVSRV